MGAHVRGSRAVLALAAAAALATSIAGCSSGSTSAASTGSPATEAAAPVLGESLAGRYAHFDVVGYESTDMKTLIISYGFTDLAVVDGKLTATESFCHSEHRSDQPISTEMSDAATSAIKPIPAVVTVTEDNGVFTISRPETPTGIGIHLADPANDPLPTDPNDPRIADDDHDGKPGVTVHIKVTDTLGGDLYIARRERFAYNATSQPDGSLVGTVVDHSEQLIVGATDDMFKTTAQWSQHPDLTKSPVILKPVDDTWDCTRLMAERPTIFPPTPAVDF
jgi:hypothetical protein